MSGVLFILAIDFILHKIQREGASRDLGTKDIFHFILAYADDMLVLARSAGDLQALLHLFNILALKIGIKFNPAKCSNLHHSNSPPAGCRPTIFNLKGVDIPYKFDDEPTEFLEKPVSAFLPNDSATVDDLRQRGIDILSSKLTPWQRIDCLKSFYFPSLSFLMRADQLRKTDWASVDDVMRPLLKRTLGIPPHAANEYLYGDCSDGLLGIP